MLIANGVKESTDTAWGAGLEVRLVLCEENVDNEMANWKVENLRFSVKQSVIGICYFKYMVTVSIC